MPEHLIQFCGQKAKVACDGNCYKVWGLNNRPKEQLSADEDDELAVAPINPGTSEGGQLKPTSSEEFPNKWCVRQCERCAMSSPG